MTLISSANVDYNTVNYNSPIDGNYWLNPKRRYGLIFRDELRPILIPNYEFCYRMNGTRIALRYWPCWWKKP